MSHARIEEVSDSDPEIDDPSDLLPASSEFAIAPANAPAPTAQSRPQPVNPTLFRPPPPSDISAQQQRREIKTHCTLYPIYFDSTRTRKEGRRVTKSLAVPNPLAWNILMAVRSVLSTAPSRQDLQLTIEPDKTHPKDWANPGRVRIQLFHEDTHEPLHPTITNKPYLYTLVGKYLKDNPTQKSDPLKLKIQGLSVPDNFADSEVPKPRGWKMGGVLPVHSCAVSGGGVSDNFFKEAMEEMKAQGQLPGGGGGGMPDMSALQNMMGGMGMGMGGGGGGGGSLEGGKKKKDKKKG